jgi:hypothetical protein
MDDEFTLPTNIRYTSVGTFTAQIYVGFREGYTNVFHNIEEAKAICQEYCDTPGVHLCVTVSPTDFIYKDGREPGCVIGLINYPRVPEEKVLLQAKAFYLANALMTAFKQNRVPIVFPDKTVMIEPSPHE